MLVWTSFTKIISAIEPSSFISSLHTSVDMSTFWCTSLAYNIASMVGLAKSLWKEAGYSDPQLQHVPIAPFTAGPGAALCEVTLKWVTCLEGVALAQPVGHSVYVSCPDRIGAVQSLIHTYYLCSSLSAPITWLQVWQHLYYLVHGAGPHDEWVVEERSDAWLCWHIHP